MEFYEGFYFFKTQGITLNATLNVHCEGGEIKYSEIRELRFACANSICSLLSIHYDVDFSLMFTFFFSTGCQLHPMYETVSLTFGPS